MSPTVATVSTVEERRFSAAFAKKMFLGGAALLALR
jgi:hypothetical protein